MQRKAHIVISLAVALCIGACNESLPVRGDISHQVVASMSIGYGKENRLYHRIYLSIKNNSDEALEDIGVIQGKIQVTWLPRNGDDRGFNNVRTFTISKNDIFRGLAFFNNQTGKLTLPSKDSIIFYVNWDMKTDDSTYLMNYIPSYIDSGCTVKQLNGQSGNRRISRNERFSYSANIKLYDQLAVLYSIPVITSECVVVPYISSGQKCFDENAVNPCTIIKQ